MIFEPRYVTLLGQLFRFGIVGSLAAILHFSVVVLLVQKFALPPLTANLFGFGCGFQISYWGHRSWTFRATEILHRIAFTKLIIVQIINLTLNETLYYVMLSMHLPYQVALLIVLTTLPIFTFMMSKLWVFQR